MPRLIRADTMTHDIPQSLLFIVLNPVMDKGDQAGTVASVNGFLTVSTIILHLPDRLASIMTTDIQGPNKWATYLPDIYRSRNAPQPLTTVLFDEIEVRARDKLRPYPGKRQGCGPGISK
jgi:hypothetical protein